MFHKGECAESGRWDAVLLVLVLVVERNDYVECTEGRACSCLPVCLPRRDEIAGEEGPESLMQVSTDRV